MVRIATWHVNSVRSRIDRLEAWLERAEVDVLAIQETKTSDEHFPYDRLRALGYETAHVGFNQWNGVAIASRVGLEDVQGGLRTRCRRGVGPASWAAASRPSSCCSTDARPPGAWDPVAACMKPRPTWHKTTTTNP